jgi:hypothetical protein
MKSRIVYISLLLAWMAGCANDQADEIANLKQENEELKILAGPPPKSLEKLYSSNGQPPVLLVKMHSMNLFLANIANNVLDQDFKSAQVNYENFKAEYAETSKLVPEWTQFFKDKPVDELGAALGDSEVGRVMGAINGVGGVCHDCHLLNMVKVQQQYHWPEISELAMTDPVSNQDADFRQFKQMLNASFEGVSLGLMQGQREYALKHFTAFNERFQSLKESCSNCHSAERTYFVDQGVQALLDQLGSTLTAEPLNTARASELVQAIGQESCGKCHLVHVPAAFAIARWSVTTQNH